jgi:hypothetical protein
VSERRIDQAIGRINASVAGRTEIFSWAAKLRVPL